MPTPFGLDPTDDFCDEEEATAAAALAFGYLLVPGHGAPQRPRYSIPRVMVKCKIRESWMRLSEHYFDPQKVYPDAYFRRM